jgi:hypothetical protein
MNQNAEQREEYLMEGKSINFYSALEFGMV